MPPAPVVKFGDLDDPSAGIVISDPNDGTGRLALTYPFFFRVGKAKHLWPSVINYVLANLLWDPINRIALGNTHLVGKPVSGDKERAIEKKVADKLYYLRQRGLQVDEDQIRRLVTADISDSEMGLQSKYQALRAQELEQTYRNAVAVAIKAKLTSPDGPRFLENLLKTGEAPIFYLDDVSFNPLIGVIDNADITNFEGVNLVGKELMRIRSQYRYQMAIKRIARSHEEEKQWVVTQYRACEFLIRELVFRFYSLWEYENFDIPAMAWLFSQRVAAYLGPGQNAVFDKYYDAAYRKWVAQGKPQLAYTSVALITMVRKQWLGVARQRWVSWFRSTLFKLYTATILGLKHPDLTQEQIFDSVNQLARAANTSKVSTLYVTDGADATEVDPFTGKVLNKPLQGKRLVGLVGGAPRALATEVVREQLDRINEFRLTETQAAGGHVAGGASNATRIYRAENQQNIILELVRPTESPAPSVDEIIRTGRPIGKLYTIPSPIPYRQGTWSLIAAAPPTDDEILAKGTFHPHDPTILKEEQPSQSYAGAEAQVFDMYLKGGLNVLYPELVIKMGALKSINRLDMPRGLAHAQIANHSEVIDFTSSSGTSVATSSGTSSPAGSSRSSGAAASSSSSIDLGSRESDVDQITADLSAPPSAPARTPARTPVSASLSSKVSKRRAIKGRARRNVAANLSPIQEGDEEAVESTSEETAKQGFLRIIEYHRRKARVPNLEYATMSEDELKQVIQDLIAEERTTNPLTDRWELIKVKAVDAPAIERELELIEKSELSRDEKDRKLNALGYTATSRNALGYSAVSRKSRAERGEGKDEQVLQSFDHPPSAGELKPYIVAYQGERSYALTNSDDTSIGDLAVAAQEDMEKGKSPAIRRVQKMLGELAESILDEKQLNGTIWLIASGLTVVKVQSSLSVLQEMFFRELNRQAKLVPVIVSKAPEVVQVLVKPVGDPIVIKASEHELSHVKPDNLTYEGIKFPTAYYYIMCKLLESVFRFTPSTAGSPLKRGYEAITFVSGASREFIQPQLLTEVYERVKTQIIQERTVKLLETALMAKFSERVFQDTLLSTGQATLLVVDRQDGFLGVQSVFEEGKQRYVGQNQAGQSMMKLRTTLRESRLANDPLFSTPLDETRLINFIQTDEGIGTWIKNRLADMVDMVNRVVGRSQLSANMVSTAIERLHQPCTVIGNGSKLKSKIPTCPSAIYDYLDYIKAFPIVDQALIESLAAELKEKSIRYSDFWNSKHLDEVWPTKRSDLEILFKIFMNYPGLVIQGPTSKQTLDGAARHLLRKKQGDAGLLPRDEDEEVWEDVKDAAPDDSKEIKQVDVQEVEEKSSARILLEEIFELVCKAESDALERRKQGADKLFVFHVRALDVDESSYTDRNRPTYDEDDIKRLNVSDAQKALLTKLITSSNRVKQPSSNQISEMINKLSFDEQLFRFYFRYREFLSRGVKGLVRSIFEARPAEEGKFWINILNLIDTHPEWWKNDDVLNRNILHPVELKLSVDQSNFVSSRIKRTAEEIAAHEETERLYAQRINTLRQAISEAEQANQGKSREIAQAYWTQVYLLIYTMYSYLPPQRRTPIAIKTVLSQAQEGVSRFTSFEPIIGKGMRNSILHALINVATVVSGYVSPQTAPEKLVIRVLTKTCGVILGAEINENAFSLIKDRIARTKRVKAPPAQPSASQASQAADEVETGLVQTQVQERVDQGPEEVFDDDGRFVENADGDADGKEKGGDNDEDRFVPDEEVEDDNEQAFEEPDEDYEAQPDEFHEAGDDDGAPSKRPSRTPAGALGQDDDGEYARDDDEFGFRFPGDGEEVGPIKENTVAEYNAIQRHLVTLDVPVLRRTESAGLLVLAIGIVKHYPMALAVKGNRINFFAYKKL